MEGGIARHVHTAPPQLLDDAAHPDSEAPPLALSQGSHGQGQDAEDRDQRSPRNSILVKKQNNPDGDGHRGPSKGARQARQSTRQYYPAITSLAYGGSDGEGGGDGNSDDGCGGGGGGGDGGGG